MSSEIDEYRKITSDIEALIEFIESSFSDHTSRLAQAEISLREVAVEIHDYGETIESLVEQNLGTNGDNFIFLELFFASLCTMLFFVSTFAVLVCLTSCCDIRKFLKTDFDVLRLCMYFTWFLFICTLYILLCVTAFLAVYSQFTTELCTLSGNALEEKNALAKFDFSEDLQSILEVCLYDYEKDSMLGFLDVEDLVSQADEVDRIARKYKAYFSAEDVTKSAILSAEHELIETYMAFSEDAYSNPYNSPGELLNKLNQWTNARDLESYQTSLGKCSLSRDSVAFEESHCDEDDTIYEEGKSLGPPLCVPMEILSDSYAERYSPEAFAGCSVDVSAEILSLYNGLKTYRQSAMEIYNSLESDLETAEVSYNMLLQEIYKVYSFINELQIELEPSQEYLSDFTGEENFDCGFVRVMLELFMDQFCFGMAYYFYIFTSLFMIISVQMFVTQFVMFLIVLMSWRGDQETQEEPPEVTPKQEEKLRYELVST